MRARITAILIMSIATAACNQTTVSNVVDPSKKFDGVIRSYFLTKAILPVTVSYDHTSGAITIKYEDPKYKPDIEYPPQKLVYSHAKLALDAVDIQTTPDGLLTKVSSTASDQTVELVKETNKFLQQFGVLQTKISGAVPAVPGGVAVASFAGQGVPPEVVQGPATPACPNSLSITVIIDLTHKKWRPERGQRSPLCQLNVMVIMTRVEHLRVQGFPTRNEISASTGCAKAVCFRTLGGMQIKIIATVSKRGRTYKTHSDIEDSEKRYKLIRQEMIPDSISVVNKKWIADRLKQLYGAARPNETENKIIDDLLEKLDEAALPKATDNKSIDERLKELDEAALPKLEEIKLWEKYGRIVAETEFETVAPRPELVGFLRFNRRAFVQNKTTATFTNGVLTGLSSTDPSSIVGFIMLPTELLKSVTFLVQI